MNGLGQTLSKRLKGLDALIRGAELGATICGADLGAKICGAEPLPHETPRQTAGCAGVAHRDVLSRRRSLRRRPPGCISAKSYEKGLYVKFFYKKG